MNTITLQPVDGRKSFYGKCRMEENGTCIDLISYTTKVATYDSETKALTIHGWYSATTARHINSFLVYFGFPTMNKKEMETCIPEKSGYAFNG